MVTGDIDWVRKDNTTRILLHVLRKAFLESGLNTTINQESQQTHESLMIKAEKRSKVKDLLLE